MAIKDLTSDTGDDSILEVKPPRDLVGLLAIGLAASAAVGSQVELQVEHYTGEFATHLITKTDDDTRVTALGPGEAGWEVCGAWRSFRAVRTDANGGSCPVYLEVR